MTALHAVAALDPAFWQGRRVLVTGHTGFKGCWLSAWLVRLGAQVTGFSLAPPARESLHWRACGADLVKRGLRDLRGDVNTADIATAVESSRPEIVLHLAAQAIVLDSYADPMTTWTTNVTGTLRVLQVLAAQRSPATFVGVTSDKCYENMDWYWGYRENDALGGKDPYSASKAACELLLASWRHSYSASTGIRVASARAGNVIGGGDDAPHRIMPDLIAAFAERRAGIIRHPDATRPYQHVLEPLSGYLALAHAVHHDPAQFAEPYNFGPHLGGEQSTRTVAELACAAWGDGARFEVQKRLDAPHEARVLMLDSNKARHKLGWTPQWSLAQAVESTVEWHKALLSREQPAIAATFAQIERYTQAVTRQP